MSGELIGIILLILLVLTLLKYITSFIFRKKVRIVDHELFIKELNQKRNLENQVLLIFSNGYWEIKEEEHSKEWSAKFGTQNYVDLDSDIDDIRYFNLMNENLERDENGQHHLEIKKEVDLKSDTKASDYLKV